MATNLKAQLQAVETSAETIGTGANQSLSNLSSTAVNDTIKPAVDVAVDNGQADKRWANAWASFCSVTDSIGMRDVLGNPIFTASFSSPNGFFGGYFRDSSLLTGADGFGFNGRNNNNAFATARLLLATGNNNIGPSGGILLRTGTSSTRGKIGMQDGSQGTVGHVWTSVDTIGNGVWAAAASLGSLEVSGTTLRPISISDALYIRSKDTDTEDSTDVNIASGNSNSGQRGSVNLDGKYVQLTAGVGGNIHLFTETNGAVAFFANGNLKGSMQTSDQSLYGHDVNLTLAASSQNEKVNLGIAGGSDSPTNGAGHVIIAGGFAGNGTNNGGDIWLESGGSIGGLGGNVVLNANGAGLNRGHVVIGGQTLQVTVDDIYFNVAATVNINSGKALVFLNNANSQAAVLQAKPNATSSVNLFLPEVDGLVGDVLTTNGAGDLTFAPPREFNPHYPTLDGGTYPLTRKQNYVAAGGGSADTTFQLPDTAGGILPSGVRFKFINKSATYNMIVQDFGAGAVVTVPPSTAGEIMWNGGGWDYYKYTIIPY